MVKGLAFALSLLLTLTAALAAGMWLVPKTSPSPAQQAGVSWQAEDSFSLRLTVEGGEAVVIFEPAARRVTVADSGDADRGAVLSAEGLRRLLAELGNDLPLTLAEGVAIAEERLFLQLEAGAHILAAEQVVAILQRQPTLLPAVVAAVINAYAVAGNDPTEQLTLLINCCERTDLSAKDGAVAHDRLVYLWESNRGGLAALQ